MNKSHRVHQLQFLHRALKVHILMIDYREYGKSEGKVDEAGTYQDAQVSYDYLIDRGDVDGSKIIVFGQSLGAAVAVDLAIHRDLYGLILEAPFTSIPDMARAHYPWLPVGSLLSTRYGSLSKISGMKAPLLVLHGDQDEIVPYEQGRRLFEAAPEPKTFYTISGSGHNDTYVVGGPAYFEVMARFVESLSNR